ncbi:serine hydrolase [Streptomyces sp. G1]|uniref:serine hydrolase n=1 Tax=Streptomyces sp. G1 TaxID=361572 RepID=UPI00203031AC|nr:serine hydrolase [Streptomyces sp. G1]MCM1965707.1 class A beta-lactamase-related serine hydrolase [Streptomyces sp. G1]
MKHRTALLLPLLMGGALAARLLIPAPGLAGSRPPRPLPMAATSAAPVPTAPAPTEAAPTPPPRAAPAPAPADPAQAVRRALDGLGAHHGRYALAALDLTSGRAATYGPSTETFTSASIIKVDILAALLLQAQDRGVPLTPAQRRLASDMIRFSDNDAAQELWTAIGRRQGLDAANARLGLTPAHAGQRGPWGLTRTTVGDQLALLKAVFTENSPLTSTSRSYVRALMGDIAADQDWGVGAGGAPGARPVLKNGWLPGGTPARWAVNSIGLVERAGHTLLIVVLTDAQPTREAGTALIERAASAAAEALVGRTP